MKDFIVYIIVRLLIAVIQALSLEQAKSFAGFFAWLCCDVFHIRGKLLRDNLIHAFPDKNFAEIQRLERKTWRHLCFMIVETALAERKIHRSNWKKYVTLTNESAPLQAMYERRPLIYATGHLGNFEFAGYIMGLIGIPPYSVARTLDNPYLNRFLYTFRRTTGQAIIPKKDAAPLLNLAMTQGRPVVILTDQHAGEKGVWVKFFDRDVSTYKVVPILSCMFNAPVVLSAPIRQSEELFHFNILVQEVLEPKIQTDLTSSRAMAQWYNNVFELLIRRTPEQYWWIHNRWRPKPERKKKTLE